MVHSEGNKDFIFAYDLFDSEYNEFQLISDYKRLCGQVPEANLPSIKNAFEICYVDKFCRFAYVSGLPMELMDDYDAILDEMVILSEKLNLSTGFEYCALFMKLLTGGYLSVNGTNMYDIYESSKFDDIKTALSIFFGYGVCKNTADFLCDFLNRFDGIRTASVSCEGFEVESYDEISYDNMFRYDLEVPAPELQKAKLKKLRLEYQKETHLPLVFSQMMNSGNYNHVINIISEIQRNGEDIIYGFDPINLSFVEIYPRICKLRYLIYPLQFFNYSIPLSLPFNTEENNDFLINTYCSDYEIFNDFVPEALRYIESKLSDEEVFIDFYERIKPNLKRITSSLKKM